LADFPLTIVGFIRDNPAFSENLAYLGNQEPARRSLSDIPSEEDVGFARSTTHEKKDVDMDPVQLSHKQTNTVPISPMLSTISLIAGVGLVVVSVRNK